MQYQGFPTWEIALYGDFSVWEELGSHHRLAESNCLMLNFGRFSWSNSSHCL